MEPPRRPKVSENPVRLSLDRWDCACRVGLQDLFLVGHFGTFWDTSTSPTLPFPQRQAARLDSVRQAGRLPYARDPQHLLRTVSNRVFLCHPEPGWTRVGALARVPGVVPLGPGLRSIIPIRQPGCQAW